MFKIVLAGLVAAEMLAITGLILTYQPPKPVPPVIQYHIVPFPQYAPHITDPFWDDDVLVNI